MRCFACPKKPKRIASERTLVGDVDDGVLREDDIDAGVGQWDRSRLDESDLDAI